MKQNPYIRPGFNDTRTVMLDVIIALLPLVAVAGLAFGQKALLLIGTSVGTAILTDAVFSALLLKKYNAALDGSAVVTGLLLAFTISPMIPLSIVAFGAFSAVLFGKIVWGGLGKNRFNPALVGREFMSVFFASVMTSSGVWQTGALVNVPSGNLFPELKYPYLDSYLSGLIYKTSGALGEYSVLLIVLGGLYLLIRRRIDWRIPLALSAVFALLFWLVEDGDDLRFSVAGVLLGTIYMATDMPSSPSTPQGKLYYGAMIGLVAFILIALDVRFEYMSYSILILNGFSYTISHIFRPRVWGERVDWKKKCEQFFLLTLSVLGVTLAVLSLHYYGMISYLVYAYIIYTLFKLSFYQIKKINNPI